VLAWRAQVWGLHAREIECMLLSNSVLCMMSFSLSRRRQPHLHGLLQLVESLVGDRLGMCPQLVHVVIHARGCLPGLRWTGGGWARRPKLQSHASKQRRLHSVQTPRTLD